MDLGPLMEGFATAATPMNLLYATIGVILGTAVGVLPGIGRVPTGSAAADTVGRPRPSTITTTPTSARNAATPSSARPRRNVTAGPGPGW